MFVFENLNRQHDRDNFDCGEEALNNYLKHQASQDIRRRLSVCVVLKQEESNTICGFYTLSAESAKPDPDVDLKAVSAYGNIPVAVLGRLAVDLRFQKQGLSQDLIAHAITVAENSIIPTVALVVDPLKPELAPFYEKLGFIPFTKEPLRLMLPFPKGRF